MVDFINAVELKAEIHHCVRGGGELAVLDIREHGQYGQGHPFLAVSCPYSVLEQKAPILVPRYSAPVVVYDDNDNLAIRAADALARVGYVDIRILEGGASAWEAAGFTLYQGVNVPSKTFGELVEHFCHTPAITASELHEMQMRGDNLILLDGRTVEEYSNFNIPGGISCPNAELPLRFDALVDDPATTVVINCAGRTRSIIGAQTLIDFGVTQKVLALENGTQGWALADLELEKGADRFAPEELSEAMLEAAKARAQRLATDHDIAFVDYSMLTTWLQDNGRTTYLIDVRSRAEFESGHIPGACHVPGGQLVQATDLAVGVLGGRIVICDDNEVRAIMAGHWLKQMGRDVYVLRGGLEGHTIEKGLVNFDLNRSIAPDLAEVSVDDAYAGHCLDEFVVVDLRTSQSYRNGHLAGAIWCLRPQVPKFVEQFVGRSVLLVADDNFAARLMALDMYECGVDQVSILSGGMKAWLDAGYAVESSPDVPSDAEGVDYLFFTGQRHIGNKEHMRQYLEWEIGLIGQLDTEERGSFKLSGS